jgi:hypothetical protein
MSSNINRVIYAGNTVLISDSPAASQQTGNFSVKLLDRIQSTSVTISTEIKKSKQIGYDTFALNNYLTSPQVSAEINYILQDNSNDLILGLNANGNFLYSNQNQTGIDKNLFFLFDVSQEGRDLNSLSNYTGIQVLGLGNAQISNYSTRASVGELPTSTVSFVANNVVFQNYDNSKYIPSVNPSGQNTNYNYKIWSGVFNKSNYISDYTGNLTFPRPGDIELVMQQPTDNCGGIKFLSYTGKIQNYEINIPFDRKDLIGFGSDYPYSRKLISPAVGTLSMNVIFDGFNTGNYSGLLFSNAAYDFNIYLKDCNGNIKIAYDIDDVKLVNQNISTEIGSSFIFDGDFEFPIGQSYGFAISGSCDVFDINASNYLEVLNITDSNTRNAINNFTVNLKENNLWGKMSGIYPLIGDSANINKYNLKDPRDLDISFRLGFSGAGTIHSSQSGVNFAGSNDYANVFFNPYSNLTGYPVHLSFLSLADSPVDSIDIGCVPFDLSSPRLLVSAEYNSPNAALFDCYDVATGRVSINSPNSKAFYTASRINTTSGFMMLFNSSTTPTNSSRVINDINGSIKPDFNIFLGAVNKGGTPFYENVSNRKFGFFSVGDGLTSGECVNLYSAVKQLQYDLNRNLDVF